jgi:hypothetical protein
MNNKEITVYQCGECEAVYKTIQNAEICCQPNLCKCGATISKTQWRCDKCKDHADKLKWECAERGSVQKDGWLWSEVDESSFEDHEEFLEGLDVDEDEFDELMALPSAEFARKYQVYICKAHKPGLFDLNDYYG